MSADPSIAVTAWLSRWALPELTADGFAQIDLDELLEDPPVQAVRTGLRCLQIAVAEARRTHADVDGILAIPLPCSDLLVKDAPEFEEVLAEPWTYGPGREVPGLYLVRGTLWRTYAPVEEYRRHLSTSGSLPSGYVTYYRTWRSEDDAARGWEYARTTYVRTSGDR